ncbi:hypothetical protein VYU27_003299 [Nannochloropsis oceanica]
MPKAAAGTPKAIANKAKSKGLQRLRWYCQMCEKQCRDENGFKCHTMSESHLRQMRVYAENPTQVMEKFSSEFEENYLETLSRLHGTKRVPANQVYQELICNKTHIHMNATKWDALTTFIKYLGKKGLCLVDETEKGWFVQWIDREYLKRREEIEKARKEEVEEEVRLQRLMAARAAAAAAATGGERKAEEEEEGKRELRRGEEEGRIVIGAGRLGGGGEGGGRGGGGIKRPRPVAATGNVFGGQEEEEEGWRMSMKKKMVVGGNGVGEGGGGKKSELEKLMEQDTARKAAEAAARKKREEVEEEMGDGGMEEGRTENWLMEGIVVKIVNKKIGGGKYYKQKGRVEKLLEGGFVGEICLTGEEGGREGGRGGGGVRLRIDQEELETVIPAVGGRVLILNGKGKGREGEMVGLDVENYACAVRVRGEREMVLKGVQYEDVCKVDRDWLRGGGGR